MILTRTLAKLAEERGKLLQAFYANAIPLELLKGEQDRIGVAEQAATGELEAAEGDLEGWQDVLRTAIRLAGTATPRTRRHVRPCAVASTTRCSRPSTSMTGRWPGRSSPRCSRLCSRARVRIRG